MCRGNDHNGRRCPSDTSEARMLRRRNASARTEYAGQVSEKVEPKLIPAEEAKTPFTAESITADVAKLKTLALTMKEAGEPLDRILLAHDELLNNIGAGVEYLATEKYGAPTDEDLRKAEVELEESARKAADERRKTLVEKDERLTEELKTLRDKLHEFANPITHPILSERWAAWDKEAPALHKEWKDKDEEVSQNRNALYTSHSKVKEALHVGIKELLEKRNDSMQEALREIGVEFANPETFQCSEDSHDDAVKSLKLALPFFPQEWVDRSNNYHEKSTELRIKSSKGRAHYTSRREQRTMRSTTKAAIYLKPADWVPDPNKRDDSEYLDLNGATEWVDPKSGVRHTGGLGWGRRADDDRASRSWVKIQYEYKEQDTPPKGKEWEKVELRDREYKDGKMVDNDHLTTYYRKPKVDREKSYNPVYKAELLVTRDSVIHVGKDAGMRVAMHEFSHRVEHVAPIISGYESAFLQRRAGIISHDNKTQPDELTSIYGQSKKEEDSESKSKTKKKEELGYKDNFPDHYMGKVYAGSNYREILSMGMESLFAGTNGALSGLRNSTPDPDYKKFILGVLASTAKSKN